MSRLEMPEIDAKLIDRAVSYEKAADEHRQYAKDEPWFMQRHCHELTAKKFEWEAGQLRKLI
jgi:hypothetical protein